MGTKSWDLTVPADNRYKYLIPGDIRDVKKHVQTAAGLYAEAQSTPDRTIAIYGGVAFFGTTRVDYDGNDDVDMGPSGAYETSAMTANYYNKILFTINSSGTLIAYEGTAAATAGAVVEPTLPNGELSICLVTVQDDGNAGAGTINNITQSDIAQIQGINVIMTLLALGVDATETEIDQVCDGVTSQVTASVLSAFFASGRAMIWYNSAAPTGWTINTGLNDKGIILTSGASETGGALHSTGSWTINDLTADSHTHSSGTLAGPPHTHTVDIYGCDYTGSILQNETGGSYYYIETSGSNYNAWHDDSYASYARFRGKRETTASGGTESVTGNTGTASASGVTSGGSWRFAAGNFICASKD